MCEIDRVSDKEGEPGCILCGSNDIEAERSINVECVNKLYKKYYSIDCAIGGKDLQQYYCYECGLMYFDPRFSAEPEFYEYLQNNGEYYPGVKQEHETVAGYIGRNSNVLEVGAGKGDFASIIKCEKYVGLEYNEMAVDKAAANGIDLRNESVQSHAVTCQNHYDVVVSFQVLEHVTSPQSFIESCLMCLKPGGQLILAVPSQDGFLGAAVNNFLDYPPHHISHWNKDVLIKLSKLFDMENSLIFEEDVSPAHLLAAKQSFFQKNIYNMLGIVMLNINCKWWSRLISIISKLLAIAYPVSLPKQYGHTIIACYSKKEVDK